MDQDFVFELYCLDLLWEKLVFNDNKVFDITDSVPSFVAAHFVDVYSRNSSLVEGHVHGQLLGCHITRLFREQACCDVAGTDFVIG